MTIDPYKKHAHLHQYSDDELYEELQDIEQTPYQLLACICAEILRRNRVRENEREV